MLAEGVAGTDADLVVQQHAIEPGLVVDAGLAQQDRAGFGMGADQRGVIL